MLCFNIARTRLHSPFPLTSFEMWFPSSITCWIIMGKYEGQGSLGWIEKALKSCSSVPLLRCGFWLFSWGRRVHSADFVSISVSVCVCVWSAHTLTYLVSLLKPFFRKRSLLIGFRGCWWQVKILILRQILQESTSHCCWLRSPRSLRGYVWGIPQQTTWSTWIYRR